MSPTIAPDRNHRENLFCLGFDGGRLPAFLLHAVYYRRSSALAFSGIAFILGETLGSKGDRS